LAAQFITKITTKGVQFVKVPEFELARLVSSPFDENTYVMWRKNRDDCLVIDPGYGPEQILALLDERKLTPAAILDTHGHSDHIAGNGALKERWPNCPLIVGHGDAPKLIDAQLNLSARYGRAITSPPADRTVRNGDQVLAAGFELDVYEIPGHSAGHVVFVWKGNSPHLAFVGDIIFMGSVGRADFYDGDFDQLAAGIRAKIFTLPDDTVLYSGHGPATTVGQEKRTNPYVRD
jgi:glyoxylase-like metal-dependent hydrolase (beta-lactamase superfamily II)